VPTSLFAPDFQAILNQAVNPASPAVATLSAPEDWRDRWRYPSESRTGPNQLAAVVVRTEDDWSNIRVTTDYCWRKDI
jgi:hypothetical protein